MTTLFGVSIPVTTYPEYSRQTLLCNKHNVSNLKLSIHSSHNHTNTVSYKVMSLSNVRVQSVDNSDLT